jgi:hypothetical protein
VIRAALVGDEMKDALEPAAEMLTEDVFTFCAALSELVTTAAVTVPDPDVVSVQLNEADWPGVKVPIVVESD